MNALVLREMTTALRVLMNFMAQTFLSAKQTDSRHGTRKRPRARVNQTKKLHWGRTKD
jgi:hypothetical protein